MSYQNVHGRRGGRGLRSWLLMPKVLGAGAYFGGLLAAAAIIGNFYASGAAAGATGEAEAEAWRQLANTLRPIFLFVAVPGLIVTIAFGIALLWHTGWVLWRMRWMKLKTAIAVVSIPLLHLFMSGRLAQVRSGEDSAAAMAQFNVGLGVAIAVAAALIFLGRHKPRLAQPVTPKRSKPAAADEPRAASDIAEQGGAG